MTSNGTLVLIVNYANSKKTQKVEFDRPGERKKTAAILRNSYAFLHQLLSHSNSRFLINLKKYFPLSNFLFCFA